MITKTREERLESIIALSQALESSRGRYLSARESTQAIQNSTVLVSSFVGETAAGKSAFATGNGLLITTNGFIVTAGHNVARYLTMLSKRENRNASAQPLWGNNKGYVYAVVDQRNNVYPLDKTFLYIDQAHDLALIKAVIPEKPQPVKFRIVTRKLKVGEGLSIFSLVNQLLDERYGNVISSDACVSLDDSGATLDDTFLTDVPAFSAFSGSPVITCDGELAGIVTYANFGMIKNKYVGGGAKAIHVVELIRESAFLLTKQLL